MKMMLLLERITMQKNDELILKIEDMGVDGAGIGKADGMPLLAMWCGRRS